MKTIDPHTITAPVLQRLLQGAVAPRPIALVSSVDLKGQHNLSPFSFFNIFGINPTTLIFSPSRRGRDNTVKHTYENVKEVPEVVINMVTYAMVEQVNLSSTEYDKGINEFVKAGLTSLPSSTVRPMRVKESPFQMECIVRQVIETGDQGGAANLVVCELKMVHVNQAVLDEQGNVDPHKIDLVGRLGGDFYVRASGNALFRFAKPLEAKGIGVDNLPEEVRLSEVLTGNDLGRLGNLASLPTAAELKTIREAETYRELFNPAALEKSQTRLEVHQTARQLLTQGEVQKALGLLCAFHNRH
ncbi:MAG: flavin reductase family protein [Bacteroidales bacterium]|nr:flavin reductase family protein [Bacteroidales bacterium]